ncbi:uncharacterized protein NECHADRAFT_82048 [Fusarium vanettenii 77-13-4]|uniref:Uncharacterized protein n=1 Tax=Fusarium vanettenii (strain ATCC MYA-4622 / CBS 123669 / FGSC 9596 / NRRL 45880 / 77-13-4) TaxID=660122 RepID=C7ZAC2_FUSV7|nr:uncharacterized protein NECHADRAFT_82048 [Fusarium vanettenii 77-13-4]EEU39651.1 predicted protein [Fusarium vanettenii 77-13-4]
MTVTSLAGFDGGALMAASASSQLFVKIMQPCLMDAGMSATVPFDLGVDVKRILKLDVQDVVGVAGFKSAVLQGIREPGGRVVWAIMVDRTSMANIQYRTIKEP